MAVFPGDKILAHPLGVWTCPHLQSDNLSLGEDGEVAGRSEMKTVRGGEGEKAVMHGNL